MKKLNCSSCGSTLDAKTFNPKYAVVNCSHCGTLHDASGLKNKTSETKSVVASQINYPRPEKIKVKQDHNGIAYSWRAYKPFIPILTIAIQAWVITGMVERYQPEFSWHGGNPANFGIVNWIIIAGCVWIISVFLFNQHRIRLTNRDLIVDQKPVPIPWKFRKTVPRNEIQQLFVAERVIHRKNQSSSTHYILRLIDVNDVLVEIPGRFYSPEEAIYIERSLEKELGLTNIKIAGEVGR